MKNIIVATDGSPPAEEAVELGIELAREHAAHVTFVHVKPPDEYFYAGRLGPAPVIQHPEPIGESKRVLNGAAEMAKAAGMGYTLELVSAPTVDGILSAADKQDADLIVVGSRGRGAMGSALLGSVSRALVRRAKRPVLVVKTTRVPVEA